MKRASQWEPILFRPTLPEGWSVKEHRQTSRHSETSFVKLGKDHHLGQMKEFWIVFVEFNDTHWTNENRGYKYTVRGGLGVKPNSDLKYFMSMKEVHNYVLFLAESTDKYLKEVVSEETIRAYDKRIADIKKMLEKKEKANDNQ